MSAPCHSQLVSASYQTSSHPVKLFLYLSGMVSDMENIQNGFDSVTEEKQELCAIMVYAKCVIESQNAKLFP